MLEHVARSRHFGRFVVAEPRTQQPDALFFDDARENHFGFFKSIRSSALSNKPALDLFLDMSDPSLCGRDLT